MQKYKCHWWVYLFGIFGMLVKQGSYLGQDFSDMDTYVLVFILLFISLLLIYYFYVTYFYVTCYFAIMC